MALDASFITALGFIVFVLLVFKPAGRLINSALDKRSDSIQHELEEALRLKEEAQALYASYQRKHQEFLKEAEQIVKHAEQEALRMVHTAHDELEEALNYRIETAMKKIDAYENAVLKELQYDAVDNTIAKVDVLLRDKLSSDISQNLFDKSVLSLDKSLS